MKKLFLFFIITLAHYHISTLKAQVPTMPGSWQWVKSIGSANQQTGSGYTDEKINMLKTDKQGNTYVCGRVMGFAHVQGLGGGNAYTQLTNTQQNTAKQKGFLAKYDCSGNLLWFKTLGDSLYNSEIGDVVIDSSGIYITAQCNWGYVNTYWGDSLYKPHTTPLPASIANGVFMKINQSGNIVWAKSATDFWGSTTNKILGCGAGSKLYHQYDPTRLFIKDDTLINFGFIQLNGLGYFSFQIQSINKYTGVMLDTAVIFNSNSANGISSIQGFGLTKDDNFIATFNINSPVNIILGSTINTPTAIAGIVSPMTIKFSRQSIIDSFSFNDSTTIGVAKFNDTTNNFNLIVNGLLGHKLITTEPYIFNSRTAAGILSPTHALVHFSNINNFVWAIAPDTTTSSVGGFYRIATDIKNDIYGYLIFTNFARINLRNFYSSGPTINNEFVLKFHPTDTALIVRYPSIVAMQPNSSANFYQFNHLSVNEKGELTATGNFKSNSIITATDTATFFGGNNDLFTIKFGYPCSSDSALIEPVATTGLTATCFTDSIKLQWADNSTIEWGYHLYRKTGTGGTYTPIKTLLPNTTSCYDASIAANTNYYYKIAAYNNIGDGKLSNIDSAIACKTIGIAPITSQGFSGMVYPNPTSDGKFTLQLNSTTTQSGQLQISNYLGQIIFKQPIKINPVNTYLLDLSHQPGGIYTISIKTNTGMFVQRVLVGR